MKKISDAKTPNRIKIQPMMLCNILFTIASEKKHEALRKVPKDVTHRMHTGGERVNEFFKEL